MPYSLKLDNNTAVYQDKIEGLELRIDSENVIGLVQVEYPKPITDDKIFYNAIKKPDTGEPLNSIVRSKNAKSACVIISDITRGVPTDKVADHIINALQDGGIKLEDIVFIVALGVHRPATTEEMKSFVGSDLYKRVRVINHDAFNDKELVTIGTTTNGTKVRVNKTAFECDIRIVVGKVELHEFAGFSGGRKSVLPGIASEDTIRINHNPNMIYAENAETGVLNNNPIHIEMVEAANMLGIDFCINFVTDDEGNPIAIYTGELDSSHLMATDFVCKFSKVTLKEKPDIIVTTCGYPLNCELYQALKALNALTDIIDEELSIVLYAKCPEGVNSPDMMRPFELYETLDEIDDYVMNNYKIQMDHTLPLTKILRKKPNIFVYAPGVTKEDMLLLRLKPCESLSKAVQAAIEKSTNEKPRILFFPQPQKALITVDY